MFDLKVFNTIVDGSKSPLKSYLAIHLLLTIVSTESQMFCGFIPAIICAPASTVSGLSVVCLTETHGTL